MRSEQQTALEVPTIVPCLNEDDGTSENDA